MSVVLIAIQKMRTATITLKPTKELGLTLICKSKISKKGKTMEQTKNTKVEVKIEFSTTVEKILIDLGREISKLTDWSPSMIADIFQLALEDANAHTFNDEITKLRKDSLL